MVYVQLNGNLVSEIEARQYGLGLIKQLGDTCSRVEEADLTDSQFMTILSERLQYLSEHLKIIESEIKRQEDKQLRDEIGDAAFYGCEDIKGY